MARKSKSEIPPSQGGESGAVPGRVTSRGVYRVTGPRNKYHTLSAWNGRYSIPPGLRGAAWAGVSSA